MDLTFAILAGVTIGSAIAAMSLRNLVHCALSLVVTFAGLAALFLKLGAEFVGLVQVLVYIGAVAILIVFALLLTRGTEPPSPAPIGRSPMLGLLIAGATGVTIAGAIVTGSFASTRPTGAAPALHVKSLGERLVADYVLPLEVLALLLTAALIGAVVIAMPEKRQ